MQFAIEYYSLQKRHKSTIIVTTTTIVTSATYLPIFTAVGDRSVCAGGQGSLCWYELNSNTAKDFNKVPKVCNGCLFYLLIFTAL